MLVSELKAQRQKHMCNRFSLGCRTPLSIHISLVDSVNTHIHNYESETTDVT